MLKIESDIIFQQLFISQIYLIVEKRVIDFVVFKIKTQIQP
jgi:hypothetical protein